VLFWLNAGSDHDKLRAQSGGDLTQWSETVAER